MIYLKRNETNNVFRRFFDRTQDCDSYYLWKIYNSVSELLFVYVTDDISPNNMYNIFNFTLSDTEPLYQSGININLNLNSGHHYYEVYETSEFSLDENKIIQLIERDILMVELVRNINTSATNDIYR